MRVKLCARCSYTPEDLIGHHDPRRVDEGLVDAVRDIPEYLRHVHDDVQGLPPTQTT